MMMENRPRSGRLCIHSRDFERGPRSIFHVAELCGAHFSCKGAQSNYAFV